MDIIKANECLRSWYGAPTEAKFDDRVEIESQDVEIRAEAQDEKTTAENDDMQILDEKDKEMKKKASTDDSNDVE